MESLRAIARAVRNMVSRGKLFAAAMAPARTVIQVRILANEAKDGVELLLPYGMSALPTAGDVLLLAVAGLRDHMVALQADDPQLRIKDLQSGEFGFRDLRGTQIVFRQDRLEVTSPLPIIARSAVKVRLEAPDIEIHATENFRFDVNGHGQHWTRDRVHTWQIGEAPGTPHPISPPEID
jgi:phage baseplate assembly protein V